MGELIGQYSFFLPITNSVKGMCPPALSCVYYKQL